MKSVPLMLSRARLQLMLRHPFLAAAAARYPLVDATCLPWCDTMATDGYNIYFHQPFMNKLSEMELTGVLAHELMHCVLGHIDRRGKRNRLIWNLAIDYATNLFLLDCGFKLPAAGLVDRSYEGLTSEDIYKRLYDVAEDTDLGHAGGDEQRSANGSDLHVDPSDPEGSSQRAKDYPTEFERRRLRIALAKEMAVQLPGTRAGFWQLEIEKANSAQIAWQALLAQFFNGLRRNDYRLFPANKKHAWRGIYLPTLGTPGPEHIVVAIDTSGSMEAKTLSTVLAEIDRLRAISECKLTLLECDTNIQKLEQFESWELSHCDMTRRQLSGRGGTDLRGPFEWVREQQLRSRPAPDALFYMTDGYGRDLEWVPDYPTYWVVPKHGRTEYPFGQVLGID